MIELKDLDKAFDNIHAVDHVSGSIREGMVFGLMWLTAALLLHISYRWTIERWMLKNALEKVNAAKNE